jgi:hypothetical protein
MPLSADIFGQTFMDDVGATTIEAMIEQYSAGAGYTGSDPGTVAALNQPGDRNGTAFVSLRGFQAPITQRDGFMPNQSTGVGITSNFDVERAEIINGPQALLYGGGGGPGGVVNLVSKEARLGQPAFGSIKYQIDQYGTKLAQLDYGFGTSWAAVRVAILQESQDTRRINVGGTIEGDYAQIAFKPFATTTVRITGETTNFNRQQPYENPTLAAPTGTGGDPRNADLLAYLIATHQTGATNPTTGAAYPSGAIDNGLLNWGNVASYSGWQTNELTTNLFTEISIDTQVNRWLTTHIAAGYDDFRDDHAQNGLTYYAPNTSGNTLGSVWAAALTPGDTISPRRTKAIRISALATNDFFGGLVHSQTSFGADNVASESATWSYLYYQADSNFNVIYGAPNTLNGRTAMPKQIWSIDNGPVAYPLFGPRTPYVTIGGVNYVRQLQNPVNPSAITPNDPLGVTLGGGNYSFTPTDNRGVYGVNYSQWLDGRLDTLLGIRASRWFYEQLGAGSAPSANQPNSHAYLVSEANALNFNFGGDYAVNPWLHPYVTISDAFDPPVVEANDPYGNLPNIAHGLGEEAGFKIGDPKAIVSGSLSFYHSKSKNEEYLLSSTLLNDINPSGLNGRWNSGNQWVNVNRESEGVQLALTANPTPNWRIRLSAAETDGKIDNTVQYRQLYNDQFNENSTGQVTYSNGTPVYIAGTATSAAAAKEVAPGTAGATPLTVSMMSDPNSLYYANPQPINGQISAGSAVGKILLSPSFPANGSILTGVSGLPISQMQINPGFTLPGLITGTLAGDATMGYPQFSANATSVYTFPTGWLKGFSLGGTVRAAWKYRAYYYFASGVTPDASGRTLFYLPNQGYFDLITGYTFKFGRISWHSQLNVTNMFNHYDVILMPNENAGFTTASTINASFTAQPRGYLWTNTFSF